MHDRDRFAGGGAGAPASGSGGGEEGRRPGGHGKSGGALYHGAAGVRHPRHSAGLQHSGPAAGLRPQRQRGRRLYHDPASAGQRVYGDRLCGLDPVHLQYYGAVLRLSARPAGGGHRAGGGVAHRGPGRGRAVHPHPAAGEAAQGLCLRL